MPADDPTSLDPPSAGLPDLAGYAEAFPRFTDREIDELTHFGEVRDFAAGEQLFAAGEDSWDFYVVIEGAVEIVRPDPAGEVPVVVIEAAMFVGELSLLTRQRRYLTARMASAGRLLVVSPDEFRHLMSAAPDLADRIVSAMLARREVLRSGEGANAIRIIGSRFSSEALALRAYAARANLAHRWVDLEDEADPVAYLAALGLAPDDVPVVLTASGQLRRPTPGEFAEHLGLTYHGTPGFLFDLVVVGTGPGGLAASVYGASEGLQTISLDLVGIGGQASASSRIENYAGFPLGIPGEELTNNMAIQAQRLGATLNSPCQVSGLDIKGGFRVVRLEDGSEIPCRAVIIASGARYQRLAVPDLERFEGAGVYYAATDIEVRACGGAPVVVVGGGNSAGQAALYLAKSGSQVAIAIRRDDLRATMSSYLIERIDADPRIEVLARTEVRGLEGDGHLSKLTLENNDSGDRRDLWCSGLFCFIGAEPATAWLGESVELDEHGFVVTDRALADDGNRVATFAGREPLPYETSVPGVFAIGDVRSGSLKRVAAAVGEGSSAVRSVHEYLAITAST